MFKININNLSKNNKIILISSLITLIVGYFLLRKPTPSVKPSVVVSSTDNSGTTDKKPFVPNNVSNKVPNKISNDVPNKVPNDILSNVLNNILSASSSKINYLNNPDYTKISLKNGLAIVNVNYDIPFDMSIETTTDTGEVKTNVISIKPGFKSTINSDGTINTVSTI
uniref:Uncharacterized protein n=1 Tax=viral metagenome TaxID=1070528 RepID=A0A6C0AYN6_9ZZZZ